MTKVDLDAMYRSVTAHPPRHDPSIHGATLAMLMQQMRISRPTAQRIADLKLQAGEWEKVRVMVVGSNGSATHAVAYRPKGRK